MTKQIDTDAKIIMAQAAKIDADSRRIQYARQEFDDAYDLELTNVLVDTMDRVCSFNPHPEFVDSDETVDVYRVQYDGRDLLGFSSFTQTSNFYEAGETIHHGIEWYLTGGVFRHHTWYRSNAANSCECGDWFKKNLDVSITCSKNAKDFFNSVDWSEEING